MLSRLASPMKPQVLMTTVRASVRALSKRTSYPAAASCAIRCSLSTVFFEQPRVMTFIFFTFSGKLYYLYCLFV